jgi:hypothetical protein
MDYKQTREKGSGDMVKIDLEAACRAVCEYCKMGMPRISDDMHQRPSGEFLEAGIDDLYPCDASRLRSMGQAAAAEAKAGKKQKQKK